MLVMASMISLTRSRNALLRLAYFPLISWQAAGSPMKRSLFWSSGCDSCWRGAECIVGGAITPNTIFFSTFRTPREIGTGSGGLLFDKLPLSSVLNFEGCGLMLRDFLHSALKIFCHPTQYLLLICYYGPYKC